MRSAVSLFWSCERSFWQETTNPLGACVMRTAVEFFCTCCPPAPLALKVSMVRSSGSIATSTSPSASGSTSTSANEVWRACPASNGDRRTRRCTPRSAFAYP